MTDWAWLYSHSVPGWTIAAAADMNRDGHPDIIWQNDDTRQVTVNFFGGDKGTSMIGWAWLYPSAVSGWRIRGAGDFNRDGHPDTVWQNDATGQVTVNYFGGTDGTALTGWAWLYADPVPGWRIAGISDMNADGSPDVVWQNDSTRQVTVNYFGGTGGTTMTGWRWLYSSPTPGWRIIVAN